MRSCAPLIVLCCIACGGEASGVSPALSPTSGDGEGKVDAPDTPHSDSDGGAGSDAPADGLDSVNGSDSQDGSDSADGLDALDAADVADAGGPDAKSDGSEAEVVDLDATTDGDSGETVSTGVIRRVRISWVSGFVAAPGSSERARGAVGAGGPYGRATGVAGHSIRFGPP